MSHFTKRLLATVIASMLALLIGVVARVVVLPSAEAVTAMPGTATIKLGDSLYQASGTDRYGMVIVGRGDAAAAAQLPGRSLVYQSGTSVNTQWDTGVPYSVAAANDWILRDSAGNLLKNPYFPSNYIGDIGSAAYQNEWARRVGDYLASVGVDGVFIDDVVADAPPFTGGPYPAKYPNQPAWETAMASFVAAVGSQLKSRGFYVAVNAFKWISGDAGSDNGSLTASWWRTLGPNVSGLMNEYWMQTSGNLEQRRGDGPEWYNNWSGWSSLVDVAQGMNRDFLGLTESHSSSSAVQMSYGMGSFLLRWDGRGSAFVAAVSGSDPWDPQWASEIGSPAGVRYAVGVGWRRDYTGGTVLVNPSPSTSQTFSLGASYLKPDGTSVTSVTLSPTTAMILRSTAPVAPVNSALPTISGTALTGSTLSSTTGTWSGSPTTYAYQWLRCDTAGAACAAVTGATTAQLTLTSSDLGKTMRVKVTGTNAAGSGVATSLASAVVGGLVPSNLTLPTITGTARSGESLTASNGTWANSPTSYTYQWQRCDSGGAACGPVSGATGQSFAVTATDVGKTLRVVVTASNAAGSKAATSAQTQVVAATTTVAAAPANTSLPTTSGTAQQGKTLTASTGTWANAPSSYAYQWRRCDSAGGACATISGATSSSYGLTAGEVGRTVRVVVTASNAGGSGTATSAASAVVTAAPTTTTLVAAPVNTAPPVISGEAQEGKSLAASTGTWSNSPTSHAYQWRRCDSSGAACADISGASSSNYTPASGDVGRTIRVAVTASNAGGSATASSAATAVVAPQPVAPPPAATPPPAEPVTNTGQPNVTGPELVGKTVDASKGSWQGNPTSFAFQWLRCLQEDLDSCTPIAGATEESYTLRGDDLDRYVIVKVTVTGAGGSASATSKLGRPIKH